MGKLPREWERVPVYYLWPDPILQRRYEPGASSSMIPTAPK